jgi:hypothetical protein
MWAFLRDAVVTGPCYLDRSKRRLGKGSAGDRAEFEWSDDDVTVHAGIPGRRGPITLCGTIPNAEEVQSGRWGVSDISDRRPIVDCTRCVRKIEAERATGRRPPWRT